MKFLADENISPVLVNKLRKEKHDVFDIKLEAETLKILPIKDF